MINLGLRRWHVLFFIAVCLLTSSYAYTWSFDSADKLFNTGLYELGLDHHAFETDKPYLKLGSDIQTFNYLWVANSQESTVSKVDTKKNREVARYRTGPGSESPSRTAVDNYGNVWVGNRIGTRAVVKIAGNNVSCIDKNGNGKIDTSADEDNDWVIDAAEILPWGDDECVLLSVNHWPELVAVGEYGPRGVAIDSEGYVWVGIYQNGKYYKLDPNDGSQINVLSSGSSYGLSAGKGVIWSYEVGVGLTSINMNTYQLTAYSNTFFGCDAGAHCFYVIAADKDNNVWGANWQLGILQKFNPSAGTVTNYTLPDAGFGASVRGVTITHDGFVWVTNYANGYVYKIDPRIAVPPVPLPISPYVLCTKQTNAGASALAGVAEDGDGNIWVVSSGGVVYKLDPTPPLCEVIATVPVGSGPYTYSDATGNIVQQFIKEGWWTVTLGNATGSNFINKWSNISWKSSGLGTGGYINVSLDFSGGDHLNYYNEGASSNKDYSYSLDGNNSENLQITIEAKKNADDSSPVLQDLVVNSGGIASVCVTNQVCDAFEDCSCDDCAWQQGGCSTGMVCDPVKKDCVCDDGLRLCKDGTCKKDCDSDCNNNTVCESNEGCSCEDCKGKQDKCDYLSVCDPISNVCSKCNHDKICDANEDCSCDDCYWKNDGCSSGMICDSEKKDCVCDEGLTLCNDGTCKEDCGQNFECNHNNSCDPGEGCSCDDCYDKEDGCDSVSVCSSSTNTCSRCKFGLIKWKRKYDNCCGSVCIVGSQKLVNLSASSSSECNGKTFDFNIFLNSDKNKDSAASADPAKCVDNVLSSEWKAVWVPDGSKSYAEYNFSVNFEGLVLGYSSNLLKVCKDDDDCDGVFNGPDECSDTPCDEAADDKGCSESQRNSCFSQISCLDVKWPDCDQTAEFVTRQICYDTLTNKAYYDGTGECCDNSNTCLCQLNGCLNVGRYINVYKECALEEEFPFFTAVNVLIVISILMVFYFFRFRKR